MERCGTFRNGNVDNGWAQSLLSETDPNLPKTRQATSQVGRNVISSRPTVIEIVIANPQQKYSCSVCFTKGNL